MATTATNPAVTRGPQLVESKSTYIFCAVNRDHRVHTPGAPSRVAYALGFSHEMLPEGTSLTTPLGDYVIGVVGDAPEHVVRAFRGAESVGVDMELGKHLRERTELTERTLYGHRERSDENIMMIPFYMTPLEFSNTMGRSLGGLVEVPPRPEPKYQDPAH